MTRHLFPAIGLALMLGACARSLPARSAVDAIPAAETPPHATIFFRTASATVAPREMARVANNARWLAAHPETVVILEGHADERGAGVSNLELGDRRARSVKALLMAETALADRALIVVSQGEAMPLDRRHHPVAWQRNRRVKFIVR